MKKIFIPFEKITQSKKTIILVIWIVAIIAFWFINSAIGKTHLFPTPNQVATGFSKLFQEGLVQHIFASLSLCFISILLAVIISMLFAYSFPIPALKPLSELLTKFRFLPLTGISYYAAMAFDKGRNVQILILVVFLTTFLTTSLIAIIKDIPQEELDHAKTLKCSRFEVLWQVVILGRIDYVIDVIRQNLAITWMMIVTVECVLQASGGIGVLIKNAEKFTNHGRVIALQIIILFIGLSLDWFINFIRKSVFRYSKI